ncbi:hypothetical protein [Cellulophaga baltica]|uniref:hypothetical protein n=1 Tax=Cellulophaga baltica TaxID=76594 RepID=UPI0015F5662A|nr:hypothetical protein [Cellulophaga baltica]MBA6316218.1 hypothetical protein [Cellulophaga baltica]
MKKNSNTPKRKRLNREQRISMTKNWIKTYNGKNIVKGYSNWFGVDLLCAIAELRMAGETISVDYEERVKKSYQDKINQRKLNKENSEFEPELINELDEDFEFIAGYTSNGMPYGIRKDELMEDESTKTQHYI